MKPETEQGATHHNTYPRRERCSCYLAGYTDAEYNHGHALNTLEPAADKAKGEWTEGKVFAYFESEDFKGLAKAINAALVAERRAAEVKWNEAVAARDINHLNRIQKHEALADCRNIVIKQRDKTIQQLREQLSAAQAAIAKVKEGK